eukprot:CAMPEP_0119408074 /NCGR_PEP_ID=MMETSP1335-20130426/1744_1 /TAXON_ID=259385 /ORGANISM="Chrysoculter rhomboideus, Strain RCC1486" /LENGTH=167 /DNA_ID=CAMNT_0007432263 /DNA_START=391 /DNA_END=891 /DNA_ORIENTATION=-
MLFLAAAATGHPTVDATLGRAGGSDALSGGSFGSVQLVQLTLESLLDLWSVRLTRVHGGGRRGGGVVACRGARLDAGLRLEVDRRRQRLRQRAMALRREERNAAVRATHTGHFNRNVLRLVKSLRVFGDGRETVGKCSMQQRTMPERGLKSGTALLCCCALGLCLLL